MDEWKRLEIPPIPMSWLAKILQTALAEMCSKECYRQGHSRYYCDTDSLATRATLPGDAMKIDRLKDEFAAPKIYREDMVVDTGVDLKTAIILKAYFNDT